MRNLKLILNKEGRRETACFLAMAIQKQEFYEGAALHQIARMNGIVGLRYRAPFFLLNQKFSILLKHSTRSRSPWGFTFTPEEQRHLQAESSNSKIVVGLICAHDGIAAFDYQTYARVASLRVGAVHIACYRAHGAHYEIRGPDGTLDRKIAPSNWTKILLDGS